jgi:plasmid stability protein
MRALRIQAAREGRKLKDVVSDVLRAGVEGTGGAGSQVRSRVSLPLVECAHGASPGEEVTPERAAEILLAQEARIAQAQT